MKSVRFFNLAVPFISAAVVISAFVLGLHSMSARAEDPLKVGLITDTDDLYFKSISWMSYQGLLRAEQELGVIGSVYTSTDPSDFGPNVLQCVQDGNDLCIGVGFLLADAISETAAISPTVSFAVLDVAYEHYLPNVRGIVFSSEEVGYLAGTLAALMSQSKTIGDLGGMPIPPVTAFTEGYRNGAQCADPGVTTIISYTNNFDNPMSGAEFAQGMISQGADVIFAAAGYSGNGAILTATQSGIWAIGVDTDQYVTLFEEGSVPGANLLLTSAMKRYDSAVFNTVSDLASGTFTPGTYIENLASEGVGLAPFHETQDAIPLGVQTWLEWIERGLIGGTIQPLEPESPCLVMHQQFLPITKR
jgi:basic membrane protein A